MLTHKHSKRSDLFLRGLTQCLTAVVLLCVYSGTLHLPGGNSGSFSDEVFCPLQKTWVKKNSAVTLTAKQREPLKDICARDERKSDFLSEFIESLRFTRLRPTGEETAKLFFAYFTDGRPALTGFVSSRNIPGPQFISSVRIEKSAKNAEFDLAKRTAEFLVPAPSPRPATVVSEDDLTSQTVTELKNISRRIKPRAPPVRV
jgi:hypothetical protein